MRRFAYFFDSSPQSPQPMHEQQESRQHWKALGEEDAGLLGETVLGRALLFLGSTFQTAIFLVAIQSIPNKDSFQGQAGGKKKKKKKKNTGSSYNRRECALQGRSLCSALRLWKDIAGREDRDAQWS